MSNIYELRKQFAYDLSSMDSVMENIMYKLVLESDDLWKLLKYNDHDALSNDDLTTTEKLNMIENKTPLDDSSKVVKLVPYLNGQVLENQTTELRIYAYDTIFANDTYVTQEVRFDIITHYNNYLVEGGDRVNKIKSELIKVLDNFNYDDAPGVMGSFTFQNNTGRLQPFDSGYIGCNLILTGDMK